MGSDLLPYNTVEGDIVQPFSFNLKNRQVLFVGGGKVAERKLKAILNEGCHITVISPEVTHGIADCSVNIILRGFETTDITEKYSLVFCCTDDRETNGKAADLCKKLRIPVNIADNPEGSDFHTTSVIRSNDFVISISNRRKRSVENPKKLTRKN